ncbi:MAG: TIGR02444 family protein [Marinagarivorans sp.]|nr:TIGR02444 family protein [Marinagarivorans sp.]
MFMDIWSFCESFYGRQPVEILSLRLQQENNVVVGLVIWFCWHYAHDRFIPINIFKQAEKIISVSQQQLILPLRQLRKHSLLQQQPHTEKIAKAILQAEILLEKNQLELVAEQTAHGIVSHISPETVGLFDYLLWCGVNDAEQAVYLLYTHAAASLD